MNLIKRRRFFKAASLAALSPLVISARTPKVPPNVLFIAIDDLNDWVGCLGGHPSVQTPNLDRLASQGLLFSHAYCAAPACNPSRAALMTGIRPSTSGVYVNAQPWRQSPVLKDAVTLPQYFMANGYKAMGSGKIYHGRYLDPASWDYYWPSLTKGQPDDPMPDNRPINGIPYTRHFDWGPVFVSNEAMGDWQVTDWVIDQLQQSHEKPFFLACGIYRPHLPWYVPQKYFDAYPLDSIMLPNVNENDLKDVPPAGRDMVRLKDHQNVTKYDQWRQAVQGYLASVSFADDCVGRVLDALDSSSYSENTIVVLWSDHGWHLGEKLHWRKFALWEEATHNVLMFRSPEIKPGRCEAPVNLLDIYPTLIDLVGLPQKPELEGSSLLTLLKNPQADWQPPALTTHGRNNHSLRSKRWRYIRYADGSEELYDHENDAMEWTNLADDPKYADVIAEHKKWLPSVNVEESPKE